MKADKCKVAAAKRYRRKGYMHKLGSKGVAGLISKYVSQTLRSRTYHYLIKCHCKWICQVCLDFGSHYTNYRIVGLCTKRTDLYVIGRTMNSGGPPLRKKFLLGKSMECRL
jgi:hypothetical protein